MSEINRKSPLVMLRQASDKTCNVELFHESTKNNKGNRAKFGGRINAYLNLPRFIIEQVNNQKRYLLKEKIALLDSKEIKLSVKEMFKKRKSERDFEQCSLEISDISTIFDLAIKVNRISKVSILPNETLCFRPYPSGGGLYPIELYIIANDIRGLERGTYHYNATSHSLSLLKLDVKNDELSEILMDVDEQFVNSVGAILILTAVLQRSTTKYGDRGYRYTLLEAGHLAQNISLAATSIEVANLAWGGYDDDALSEYVGIDCVNEPVVHMMFLGKSRTT